MIGTITTSHQLAIELLKKPEGFVTIAIDGKEYLIGSIKRKSTLANYDDSILYWVLNGEYESKGNLKWQGE